MQQQLIDISLIDTNDGQVAGLPANPRFIEDDDFHSLVNSLKEDPDMLQLRELIVFPSKGRYITIGGNQRLRAARQLNFTEMPCKVLDADVDVEKLKRLTIKDNGSWGEHDWDLLATEWADLPLNDWGMDLPIFMSDQEKGKKKEEELKPYCKTHILLSFNPQLIEKIKQHLDEILKIDGIEYEQSSN